jgi:hypothetical protein
MPVFCVVMFSAGAGPRNSPLWICAGLTGDTVGGLGTATVPVRGSTGTVAIGQQAPTFGSGLVSLEMSPSLIQPQAPLSAWVYSQRFGCGPLLLWPPSHR